MKKTAKKKARQRSCEDCGYAKRHLHDDCPMCEACSRCGKPLMQCKCKESE